LIVDAAVPALLNLHTYTYGAPVPYRLYFQIAKLKGTLLGSMQRFVAIDHTTIVLSGMCGSKEPERSIARAAKQSTN
jgi:hypothetical protein